MRPRLPSLCAASAVVGSCLLVVPLASPATASPHSSARISTSIAALAAEIREKLRGSTAGHVAYRVDVAGVGSIRRNQRTQSAPASNEKLLTAVASYEILGTGYRFHTRIAATGPVIGHVLDGDLVLRGSGDPTLRSDDLARLARNLRQSHGIRRITGHLVIDDTRYGHKTRAPGWKSDYVGGETGPVTAFALDRNSWREDSAYLDDPTRYNARRWRDILHNTGISVDTRTIRFESPLATHRLVMDRSPTLAKIWDKALPQSDNYTAEMLLREIGAVRSGRGTLDTGVAAILDVARKLHVGLGTVLDGSGLSSKNRESPRIFRRWLRAAKTLESFPALYDALPRSCEDDTTLEDRLCGRRLTGAVVAKTGTLSHARTLTGFTTTRSGHRVTFSIMLAEVRSLTSAVEHIDAAVAAIVRSRV